MSVTHCELDLGDHMTSISSVLTGGSLGLVSVQSLGPVSSLRFNGFLCPVCSYPE